MRAEAGVSAGQRRSGHVAREEEGEYFAIQKVVVCGGIVVQVNRDLFCGSRDQHACLSVLVLGWRLLL